LGEQNGTIGFVAAGVCGQAMNARQERKLGKHPAPVCSKLTALKFSQWNRACKISARTEGEILPIASYPVAYRHSKV
jgi:hypothetical protein